LPLGDGGGQGFGLLAEAPPLLLPDVEGDELELDPPPLGADPVVPGFVVPGSVVPGSVVPLVAPGTVPQGEPLGELRGLFGFGLGVDGWLVPPGVGVPGEAEPGAVPGFPLACGFWVPVGGATAPVWGVTVPVGGAPEFGDEF